MTCEKFEYLRYLLVLHVTWTAWKPGRPGAQVTGIPGTTGELHIPDAGQSQETLTEEGQHVMKLSKADVSVLLSVSNFSERNRVQICFKLGAKFLVDDSLENLLKCANHTNPTPVLLFGRNQWNLRR